MNKHLAVLDKLLSSKEIIQYCTDNLELIGRGSSRIVFRLSKTMVIKVAFNQSGIYQNQAELKTWMVGIAYKTSWMRFFATLYVDKCHFRDLYVVQQYVTKCSVLNRHHKKDMEFLLKIVVEFDELNDTYNERDILPGNLGKIGKQVKMLDYGFCSRINQAMIDVNKYRKIMRKTDLVV